MADGKPVQQPQPANQPPVQGVPPPGGYPNAQPAVHHAHVSSGPPPQFQGGPPPQGGHPGGPPPPGYGQPGGPPPPGYHPGQPPPPPGQPGQYYQQGHPQQGHVQQPPGDPMMDIFCIAVRFLRKPTA